MRLRLAGLVLWAAACGVKHSTIEVDIPDDITHVAVVEVDEHGEVLFGSPLHRIEPNEPFGIASGSESNTLVVGYSRDQLAPYDVENRAELVERARLERPDACAPRLPIPKWSGVWSSADRLTTSAAPGPIATADFLKDRCPDLSNVDIDIDRRCSPVRCSLGQRSVGPCRIELDLLDCGLEPAMVTFDPRGQSCIEWGRNEALCESGLGVEPSIEQLSCGGESACLYDLYANLDPDNAPFETDTVRLFDAPPFVHTGLRRSAVPVPRARLRYTGYALDMIVLGARVLVVVTHDNTPNQECAGLLPRQLFAYDVDSLERVRSSTVPACMTQLLPDPSGDGFLATFALDGEWHVGRFDERGRMLQARPVDGRSMPGPSEPVKLAFVDFEPADVALVDGGRWMAALFDRRRDFDMTMPRSIVTLHDTTTMEMVARHELEGVEDARSLTVQGDQLVLASPFTHRVLWIDALSGDLVDALAVQQDTLKLSSFSTISTNRDESLLLVGVTGGERALMAIRGGSSGEIRRMVFFDREVDTFAQTPWPSDPSRFVIGGISLTPKGEWVGVIGFNEPEQSRFSPDTWEIGAGLVSQLEADDAGRIFALLPWVPALVRLTPKP